jgi:predicted enzyme related to lactoylglutathione lyase
MKGKVTGVGGVFFKTKDAKKTKDWYADNLGLVTDDYGSSFESRNVNNPEEINYLQWSPFKEDTDYFEPSEKNFMINYRVEHIEDLLEQLQNKGVTILDEIQTYDYGKFLHILDNDGNKIELWEPVDKIFTDLLQGKTTK